MSYFTDQLNLRLTREDKDRAERLAARTPFKPSAIAREAYLLGLEQLEKDPELLVTRKTGRITKAFKKGAT